MCVIVDVNVAAEVFFEGKKDSKEFEPVRTALKDRQIRLAIGGKLYDELCKNKDVKRAILEYQSVGRVERIDEKQIKEKTELIKQHPRLQKQSERRKNDPHILALACISGARILISRDKGLRKNFTDIEIISPRGHLFLRTGHSNLLSKESLRCPGPRRQAE